jgi:hypothetical protein
VAIHKCIITNTYYDYTLIWLALSDFCLLFQKIFTRYDTFVILKNKADVDKILSFLNDKHHTIKFTVENEAENSLNFLDMKIKRNEDLSIFLSTYRKPTFTGTMLNWNSHTSIKEYDIRKDLLIASCTGHIQSDPTLNNLY